MRQLTDVQYEEVANFLDELIEKSLAEMIRAWEVDQEERPFDNPNPRQTIHEWMNGRLLFASRPLRRLAEMIDRGEQDLETLRFIESAFERQYGYHFEDETEDQPFTIVITHIPDAVNSVKVGEELAVILVIMLWKR